MQGPIHTPGLAEAWTCCRGAATNLEQCSLSSQLRYAPHAHPPASVSPQDHPLRSPQDADSAWGTGAPATEDLLGRKAHPNAELCLQLSALLRDAPAGGVILGLNQGKFSSCSRILHSNAGSKSQAEWEYASPRKEKTHSHAPVKAQRGEESRLSSTYRCLRVGVVYR